jgi:plastocyanin
MSNLSWLSGLISENEGSVKLLNGTNLAFSGTEIVVSDGPTLNILHEFDIGTYGSAHYVIHAECGTDQRETLNASVVAKYDAASITVYGRINTGVNLINLQADITDGVLKLYATSAVQGLQKIRVTAFATLAESIVDVESNATVYYFSKVNATPKYTLNLGLYSIDETAPSLTFYKGLTYRIDQSHSSNSQDPILVGETTDAVNSPYALGVSYYLDNKKVIRQTYTDLTRYQSASSRYIEVSVGDTYPDTLYYYSSTRPQLGNTISIASMVDVGSAGSGSSGSGGSITPTTGANQELSNLGVTAINSSLIPAVDSSIDLGSAFNKWKDLYLSGNTLFLGNASITATGNAVNLPAGSTVGGQTIGAGGVDSGFSVVAVAGQSNILASNNSSINFAAGANITLTTDALTGTITIASASGGGGVTGNAFTTIAVSGQSPVVAESATETLTLIAGPNITLTTNPAGDAVTISASATGTGGASGVSSGQANRLAYYASTGSIVQDSGPNLEWNGTFLQLIGTVYVTGQKSYVRQYWDSLSDLNIEAPPNVWRGMVAYSGDTGRVYYAHNGAWNRLARFDEIPATVNAFGRIQAGGQTIASTIPNDILSIVGGVGIEVSSDPTTKTLLITNTGGGTGGDSGFSAEDAQDSAASLFLTGQHTGITFTYDDFNNRINAAVTAIAGIYTDEQAQDAAGLALTSGVHNGITFTYDDANNRIDASIFNDSAREYIQDQSAALFTAGVHSNISFTYDDANNRINASVLSPNIFSTIAVSGQLNVVADSTSDTLTLVAGTGIAITTNATTDAITITSTVSGGVTAFTGLSDRADLTVDRFYLPAITMLSTTNNGASSYRFDQYGVVDNPTVYAINGTTIAFNLNVPGHPFLIQTSGGVNYNEGLTHVTALGVVTTGAAAQGKTDGTLYWKIPISISGNYRYICAIHGGMVGVISIKDFSLI